MVFADKLCYPQLFCSLGVKQIANEGINDIKILSEQPALWCYAKYISSLPFIFLVLIMSKADH